MQYEATQTGERPLEYEQPDELTPAELERIIRLARDVKTRKIGRLTVDIHVHGGLYIMGWRKAA